MATTPKGPGDASRGAAGSEHLQEGMSTLTTMIRSLEEQLDRVVGSNDALSKDLEDERRQRVTLEGTIVELKERLKYSEQQARERENLQTELHHINQERGRLSALTIELNQKLDAAAQDHRKQVRLIERLKDAHEAAVEEARSVEAQFERAMGMVSELRAQLKVMGEERDALSGRVRVLKDKLSEAERERDALMGEVENSRSALDEIRRSLVDAVVTAGPLKGTAN